MVGEQPKAIDGAMLEKLRGFRLQIGEFSVPEEVEYGWSGGRHVLDGEFGFEHNVFADAMFFGLRVDTNKVPGVLKKAYEIMEADAVAAGNPSGFISKNQKRDVKETVRKKVEDELREGKWRRSKIVPILWDLPTATVFCSAGGTTQEQLLELFNRTFELELSPVSAGSMALSLLEPAGHRRDYEDLRPTRFVAGTEGEGQYPDYPWTAKGAEPKDFLGNEFLLWLWHEADAKSGVVATEEAGDVAIVLDRSLELECAYGQSGKDALKADGASRMPEARDALRSGKVPRKAAMIVNAMGHQYEMTFNPEALFFSGAKLPEVEEADSPRVLFEERIALLRDLCRTMDALYATFLRLRASSSWEGQVATMKRWIAQPMKGATGA